MIHHKNAHQLTEEHHRLSLNKTRSNSSLHSQSEKSHCHSAVSTALKGLFPHFFGHSKLGNKKWVNDTIKNSQILF